MKIIKIALLFLFCNYIVGQNKTKKINELESNLGFEIVDYKNSNPNLEIDSLNNDEIPEYFDFKGTVLSAIKWKDELGESILIHTVTGVFETKQQTASESNVSDYETYDKSELYVYLFHKKNTDKLYNLSWKIYDFSECYGVDIYAGFIKNSTTITD